VSLAAGELYFSTRNKTREFLSIRVQSCENWPRSCCQLSPPFFVDVPFAVVLFLR
jgi:hypothetical protein